MIVWTRLPQLRDFPNEFHKLSQKQVISNRSKLLNLYPYFDNILGCIRVGGRLRNANLSPDEKCPFILSPDSNQAHLIIKNCHQNMLHGGIQLTLSAVRESH